MCLKLFVYFHALAWLARVLEERVWAHVRSAFQQCLAPLNLSACSMSQLYICAMQLESTAVHHRASVQQRSMMMAVVYESCEWDFCAHFNFGVCVCDTVSSDLVSIPAQLVDVLQELVGAHVGCVQAGLMLAGHLRGTGRGFLTPGFICSHRQGNHLFVLVVFQAAAWSIRSDNQQNQRESGKQCSPQL